MNSYVMYKPYAVFMTAGLVLLVIGLVPIIHYVLAHFASADPSGTRHLQSLIIGVVLLNASFMAFALGVIAHLSRVNRSLIEDVIEEQRRDRYKLVVEKA